MQQAEDKEVDGNVSVSKCLADFERVYSRGSSVFCDGDTIASSDCRDIHRFIILILNLLALKTLHMYAQ